MIHRFTAQVGERTHEVTVEPLEDGAFRVSVDGRVREIDARRVEAGAWSLVARGGGGARLVDVDVGAGASEMVVTVGGQSVPIKLGDARRALPAGVVARGGGGPQPVRAPMPGKVVKLLARAGETVKAGQGVVVIEAMKMENELRAPRDGVLVEVSAEEGQAVEAGQVLATIG